MTIAIIDDHEVLKEGLFRRLKNLLPEANIIFVKNVKSLFAQAHYHKFDLVLCDIEFDDTNLTGFDIIKSFRELEPEIKMIAFTHHRSYRIMKQARRLGFNAFLNKGCSIRDFNNTIVNVLEKGEYISETEKELRKKRMALSEQIYTDSLQALYSLTPRELDIVITSADSSNRNYLSEKLNITPYTVDTYVKRIFEKLNMSNRKDLEIFAKDFYDRLIKIKNEK